MDYTLAPRGHTYRLFVHGMRLDDFRRAFSEDERRTFNVNAYGMCGRSCVADLGRWLRRGEFNWSLARVPELVFEDGDIGKGKLKDLPRATRTTVGIS